MLQAQSTDIQVLLTELRALRRTVDEEGRARFAGWHPGIQRRRFLLSALNLAHYLAFRQRELRELQLLLPPLGMSSLGHSEARVVPNLDAVIATLGAISGEPPARWPTPARFYRGQRLLEANADELFGPAPSHRRVRIMVTLPTEAAVDSLFVERLIRQGMNVARINCAHDDETAWQSMIANVRRAETAVGQQCRILMDLAGPKIRTGSIRQPDDNYRVHHGDAIVLTGGKPSKGDRLGVQVEPAELLAALRIGDPLWIDDGKIGVEVVSLTPNGVVVRVTQVPPKGGKLRPGKGLNAPETDMHLPPISDHDRAALDTIATEADIVGFSFVQSGEDMRLLQNELAKRPRPAPIAIMAKIETRRAVNNLPEIIVQAAATNPFGVMIARGDLAVEIGYDRLAEIQEELLWICEAAHAPVIWATQVLETLVKTGQPSRAEMTDAAMSERAECVMLNKGPYVLEAVAFLDNVLTRMEQHQLKKMPQLRALRSWREVIDHAAGTDPASDNTPK